MLSTWFAHPGLLYALLALPIALAFMLFAHFRRKQLVALLGGSLLARKSVLVRPRVRRWKALCVLLGLALVCIACAGPQWGIDKSAQHRKGRDVLIVLDLSRSMTAEQPSRRELAVRALRQLADTFEAHGGNRVGLIIFASQAELLFPLTHDCDHLRHVLTQIDADDVPKLSGEEPKFGTRIGAALKLAVDSCDPRRSNRPIVVLLSDGDDPAGDEEWRHGIEAANEKRIRIHTVGIGDPRQDETIPLGREVFQYDGKPILTRLREEPLREIARRTDGVYIAAHNQALPLGTFVQHLLDADELRDEPPSADALPVYKLQYDWFLCPAVLLFMIAMFLSEGPTPKGNETSMPRPTRFATARAKAATLLLVFLALLTVSAADPPGIDELVRRGNEAFARDEYDHALKLYVQAEELSLDPGLLSFNKAAAYYRLKQHKKAIESYRLCLQDDRAPFERRARAYFDLGNALYQYADGNASTLAEAVAAYRACLDQPTMPEPLRVDARHNLEKAQRLWGKVRPKTPDDGTNPDDPKKAPYPEPSKDDDGYKEVDPDKNAKREQTDKVPKAQSKTVRSETPQHLPDTEKIQPLSPEGTLHRLEQEIRRIAEARRRDRNPPGSATLTTKDW